jgi:hypothetical protein
MVYEVKDACEDGKLIYKQGGSEREDCVEEYHLGYK